MGLYLQADESDALPLASNVGWGDVCRWAEHLPGEDSDAIKHLCLYGWEQDIADLTKQLESALSDYTPRPDTVTTLENLLTMLKDAKDAKIVIVTDGLTSEEPGEEEDAQKQRIALSQWERKALNRLRTSKSAETPFQTEEIAAQVKAHIVTRLAGCTSPDAVKALFREAAALTETQATERSDWAARVAAELEALAGADTSA